MSLYRRGDSNLAFYVTLANGGIQDERRISAILDPRVREDDGTREEPPAMPNRNAH